MRWRDFLLFPLGLLFASSLFNWVGADSAPQEANIFRLGVVAERPDRPVTVLRQYDLLHTYLSEALSKQNIQVDDLVVTRHVPEMASQFAQNAVDAVIEGIIPILLLEQLGVSLEPTLLVWRKGQREYQSVFFVRQDSPIVSLEALRGHTIAFESQRSTSAFFVPLAILREQRLFVTPLNDANAPADAVRYVFADSELNQAYWVQRGKVDAGAFNDGDWDRVPAVVRKDLRIIDQSPPLPRWLIAFRTDLDPQIKQAVTDVLLDMHRHAAGQEALLQAERITKFENLQATEFTMLDYWRQRTKYMDPAL